MRLGAKRTQAPHGSLAFRDPTPRDDQPGAAIRHQSLGNRQAQALRPAGDHRHRVAMV